MLQRKHLSGCNCLLVHYDAEWQHLKTCELHCLGNVAEMRDIVFQLDFLPRILLFHLVLALVIILEVGASLLLMNSDAPNMVTFLVSNNENDLIMRRNLLISVSIGMTWRKRRKNGRNISKKRNWRPVFN
ncbi:hypothetical protein AMTRI_Chr02g253740 [Amborella trichopoda]